jgi:hypothetical protein
VLILDNKFLMEGFIGSSSEDNSFLRLKRSASVYSPPSELSLSVFRCLGPINGGLS